MKDNEIKINEIQKKIVVLKLKINDYDKEIAELKEEEPKQSAEKTMTKFKDVDLFNHDGYGRPLGEHETLLSFNNDGGNYAFNDWWNIEGSALFNEWCLKSDEYNCEATEEQHITYSYMSRKSKKRCGNKN